MSPSRRDTPDLSLPLDPDFVTPPRARVVNVRKTQADVYVGRGRGSIFGNPFVLEREEDRALVIAKYRVYALANPRIMAALPDLRGKTLGCWCAPKPCHADVLAELANALDAPAGDKPSS